MNHPQSEVVIAAATGSAGGLGKIGTIAATTGTLLARIDNVGFGRTDHIDYRVESDQAYSVQLYRSRTLADSSTLTLAAATRVDDTDTCILNALTYTAESTAGDAAWASRKWKSGGADEAADAAQLAAVINADYAITPNGSVTVGDTITVVTTDDAMQAGQSNTYTFTAAAAPSYTTRVFDQSGNQAAELASIVLALNHKRNVTLATCLAGTTISFIVENGIKKTYTAHATTTTAASREFSISGSDSQDGDELVTCLNDSTYGLGAGYTAVNAAGVVSITRNYAKAPDVIISSSDDATAACVNTAGGVPGVAAVATGATGELAITPTWVKSLVVTTSNGTRLAIVDIDNPGLLATVASAVITLTPGTPGAPSGGEKCTVIQFAQGTSDAAEIAYASTTLTNLTLAGSASTGLAANSTTSNGLIFTDWIDGWDYGYVYISNGSGSAQTVTVAATKY